MIDTRVRLDRVRKHYENGHVAVADATFDAGAAELLVLVGPSGCGKSTLLRMVAGLESITSGTLSIGGRVVNDVPPKDRDVAMVFQSYALYPHMSVAENMAFGLKLRGAARDVVESRVREAAALLGLESMLDRRPRHLSGGQRQRVALGRALVRQPQVFLLDEPLSNLDAKLRLTMRTEIARLHRRLGTTMLYVTHDQVEAMTLGHRIVVMNAGAIQQIDTPMAIYERPANVFVATFLGSPAMNLFRGRFTDDGRPRLIGDGLELGLEGVGMAALGRRRDRELVVGVRPEHVTIAGIMPVRDERTTRIAAVVDAVEPVGHETFVTARAGVSDVTIRVAPHDVPAPGTRVELAIESRRLHLFDADGSRID